MKGPDRHATDETRRTATCAVLAGLPGLVLSALAALGSTSLALRVDLLLTLLDMVALAAA